MIKRNKKIIMILSTLLTIVLGISISYAFFYYGQESDEIMLESGSISINFEEDTNYFGLHDMYPKSDVMGKIDPHYYDFSVTGSKGEKDAIEYEIQIVSNEMNTLKDKYVKVYLTDQDDNPITEPMLLNELPISEYNENRVIFNEYILSLNEIDSYRLRVWVDDDYSENVEKTYSFQVVLYAENYKRLYETVEETLSDYLLPDDGDARIISGSKDDANLKNYVWYSGKLWRIVALNNDGSIKLVTQDNITTISWGSNTTYVGSWMYQWLNEDFLDTLYNYENIIVTDYEWNATVTTATTKPAKTTMVEAAVGLLTAYEYTRSYSKLGTYAYSSGYLNNGYIWWLMTPYSSSYVRRVDFSGNLYYNNPHSTSRGGRPSINLSSNIKIKGNGDGSRGNPYLLEGDITEPTNNITKLNERVSGEYLKFDNELYRIVNIENGITKITKTDYIREGGTVVNKYLSSTVNFGSVNNETCIDGIITYTVDGTTYTRNCNEHWDYYLNNDWYNSISTSPINYKGMVVEGTWYLGQYPDKVSYKNTICADTNTTETTKNCTRTTAKYEGYVGLGRVGESFTSQIGTGYENSIDIWTITPGSSSYVRSVVSYGFLSNYYPYSNSYGGRPSINLSSNIVITGGFGTENEPFEIAMG